MTLDELIIQSHSRSKAAGWWRDPITGESLIPGEGTRVVLSSHHHVDLKEAWFPYVIATKIALIHSEVSEALEAYRRDAVDDKLPQYPGIAVELADAMIRIGDLLGLLQSQAAHVAEDYNITTIIEKKFSFNAERPDHQLNTRATKGGKKF